VRIGIDAHVLGKNIGGVEPYVEAVVRLLPGVAPQHEYVVFLNRSAYSQYAAHAPHNVKYVPLPASDPLLERSVVLPWMIRRHRLDLIHVQRIAPMFPGRCGVLLTVHDLILLKHPERYRGFRYSLIRKMTPGSIRSAAMIVTPTAAVAREIATHFPDVRAPILKQLGVSRPFLLTVGGIEPRKNIELLIRVLGQLGDCGSPSLVLVGIVRDPAHLEHLKAYAAERGVADRLHFLGFVSHAHLADLYRSAAALVTASWDEGFNLSPLEAMASGTPVVCSDIPAHRELYESCAPLLPVDSVEQFASAIRAIMNDPSARAAAAEASRSCVHRLSWEAMAQRMGSFIEELQ
jgi:glycosyltransferase involved in cell wall biosynthesis